MSIIQIALKAGLCIGVFLVLIGTYELFISGKEADDVHAISKSALEMGGTGDQVTEQQRKDHPVASGVFDASEASIKFLDKNALVLLRAIALVKMVVGIVVCLLCTVILGSFRRRLYRRQEMARRL